jgi:hypothetical protein
MIHSVMILLQMGQGEQTLHRVSLRLVQTVKPCKTVTLMTHSTLHPESRLAVTPSGIKLKCKTKCSMLKQRIHATSVKQ